MRFASSRYFLFLFNLQKKIRLNYKSFCIHEYVNEVVQLLCDFALYMLLKTEIDYKLNENVVGFQFSCPLSDSS